MNDSPELLRDEDGFLNRGAEVTRAEAFFDAAFAFAITLMVISIDAIPDTAEKLVDALKSVPAFGASFLMIVLFWRGHADWSRRYGLNDRYSQRLSLLLVFIVLVFIYPLRMVFGAFFQLVGGEWFYAHIHLQTVADARVMFVVFALGLGAMGLNMTLLYWHAWSQRERLGLDAIECLVTRHATLRWATLPAVSLISLCLSALLLQGGIRNNIVVSMPGLIFFSVNIIHFFMDRRMRRARSALQKA